ncbi:MAG: ABC transporter six-transmembrane domain-containing protein [Pseudomonadota bacterium]
MKSPLTVGTLLRRFQGKVLLTWTLILVETMLMALIPLLIGLAIDGLLQSDYEAFLQLAWMMVALVVVAIARRIYDTRVYATARIVLARSQAERRGHAGVSTLNARVAMGRELVDFLESTLPDAMAAAVQLLVALAVLLTFSPVLALASALVAIAMAILYACFHGRFFRLNGVLNQQSEQQVTLLRQGAGRPFWLHLLRLRRVEVQLSDTEAGLYGLVFLVLFSLVLFNLWFAAAEMTLTAGMIFSIVSYSWEFVDSALALPITLQSWSRLAEIMARINDDPPVSLAK